MSWIRCLSVTLAFTLTGAVSAGDEPTPLERLRALKKEVNDADDAFREARQKLEDPNQNDPAVAKLYQVFRKKQRAAFDAAVEIAKDDPKSDAGFACLDWVLSTYQAHYLPAAKPALALLTEHHADNPKLGVGVALLAHLPPHEWDPIYSQSVALFKAVVDRNPDKTVRGQAAYGLASLAMEKFRAAESRSRQDVDRLAAAAEAAYVNLSKEYGECRYLRLSGSSTTTLGELASGNLTDLRKLRIGMPAPDITGEDLAGGKFKLSDQRGKVVLLVFWASWCGPCMAEVPHEKELVERFKGRPFVLTGVNGDSSVEKANKAVKKHGIPWRSFWNGEDGPSGSIAAAWNVRGWPTVYVIDAQGVIRQRYLHGKRLDSFLDKLVSDAEAK